MPSTRCVSTDTGFQYTNDKPVKRKFINITIYNIICVLTHTSLHVHTTHIKHLGIQLNERYERSLHRTQSFEGNKLSLK